MYTTLFKSKVALLACLVAIASAGVASAFNTRGGNCSGCHTNAGGSMATSPSPLNVQLASNGLISFNVSNVAGAANSAICVQFGDATLYNNVSVGAGGSINWTKRTTGGNGITSDYFANTGTYTLNLAIGAGAPKGSFPLTLWLSGTDAVATQYANYVLNVIPEPATCSMLLLGTFATFFRRGRRA